MGTFQPSEIDDFMNRVKAHKKVLGSMFITKEGLPIKTTMDTSSTDLYASVISELSDKAGSVVKAIDPADEVTFIHMHTKKHDIMIAPDSDKGFGLIVIQGVSK